MKRKTILTLLVLVMILSIIGLVACNNKEDSSNNQQQEVKVETYVVTVVDGIGAGTYKKGANATVTAQNKGDGYTFIGWYSGEDFVSTQNPYTFKVTRTITLTATYSYDEYYSLSENEKDDFINDKTKKFVARNVNDTSKAFDHWNTKVEEDTTTKSILGGSEKSAKITIDPIQNSEGDYLDQSVSSGVWSTVDFGFMNKEINVFDYNYIEFDAKFSNAQKWTSVRFVDAKGNVSTELGLDARASETGKYSVLVSADGWYHFAFDIATLYDYAKLTNTESELVPAEKTNYDVIKNAVGIRVCTSLSGKDVDGKYEAIINIDNLKLNKTAQDVTALKYTVTAVDGTITDAATDNKYDKDAEITVTATDKSEQCYVFVGWSDGETIVSEDNPYTFAVTKNINLTATYEQKFTVTIVGGTETSLTVDPNATPTITATAKNGYDFTGWKKDSDETIVSTSLSYTIPAVTANVTYTAVFTAITETGDLITLATITADKCEAYNVKTTNSASAETVALKITAESECGYPSIIADIGSFNMLDQKLVFNLKIAKGYPWFSFKYLDADKAVIGSLEGNITKDTWVEIERSEVVENAKYIKITFNADGEKPATMEEIEAYIDAFTIVNRPTTHKYAITHKAGIELQNEYSAISLSSLVGKALYFEYKVGDGSGAACTIALMDDWNNATGNFALNKDGTVGKGVVKSLGDGWYGITIPYNQFNGNELKDAEELNFIYAAADKMGYDLTIDYYTFNVVSIPIVTVVDGTIENATSDNAYLVGSSLKVTAIVKDRKTFAGWTNGKTIVSTDSPYTFTVSESVVLTATYIDSAFIVTVVDGTITPSAEGNKYLEGTEISIAATNKEGQVFIGWSDGSKVVSTNNPYIVTVNSAISLTAQYTAKDPSKTYYDVTIKADGETAVTSSVEASTQITLTPTTKSGYEFIKWVDGDGADITVTDSKYTVTSNITIVATYHSVRGTKFVKGTSVDIPTAIEIDDGIEFDYYILTGTTAQVLICSSGANYFGTFGLTASAGSFYDGNVIVTALANDYYHVSINLSKVNRTNASNNRDNIPSSIDRITVHGSWGDATGYIDNITVNKRPNVVSFTTSDNINFTIDPVLLSDLQGKSIYFEYKIGEGGSSTSVDKISLLDTTNGWSNISGQIDLNKNATANKGAIITSLGDGWYGISIPSRNFDGDGTNRVSISLIYWKWTAQFAITFDKDSFKAVDDIVTVSSGSLDIKIPAIDISSASDKGIYFEYKIGSGVEESKCDFSFINVYYDADAGKNKWSNIANFRLRVNGSATKGTVSDLGNGWYGIVIPVSAFDGDGTVRDEIDYIYCGTVGFEISINVSTIELVDRTNTITFIEGKKFTYDLTNGITKADLEGKSLYFEYKIDTTNTSNDGATVRFLYEWADGLNVTLNKDGTANKGNVVSLGDGWYGITIAESDFNAHPSDGTKKLNVLHNNWGLNRTITIDLDSIKVVA